MAILRCSNVKNQHFRISHATIFRRVLSISQHRRSQKLTGVRRILNPTRFVCYCVRSDVADGEWVSEWVWPRYEWPATYNHTQYERICDVLRPAYAEGVFTRYSGYNVIHCCDSRQLGLKPPAWFDWRWDNTLMTLAADGYANNVPRQLENCQKVCRLWLYENSRPHETT